MPTDNHTPPPDAGGGAPHPDFSPVLGGPLYHLYRKSRLVRPPLQWLGRRMLAVALLCWLPPFLLAAAQGRLRGGVTDPFLRDPEVHVRLLLVLPLLIAAEIFVHERIHLLLPQFAARGLVAPPQQPRFDKILVSAARLRDSPLAELILLLLSATLGFWMWRHLGNFTVSSWYAVDAGAGPRLTAAGAYYALVSLAIARFILYRWYFRLFIWYRVLWQVRGLRLQFNLYHPDRAGGLGFLGNCLPAFAPVFAAQTALLSAYIYNQILYSAQSLRHFDADIVVAVLLCMALIIFPLGFFSLDLDAAARRAKAELGTLASGYVTAFRAKWWIAGGGRAGENMLGTPDLQSLADLANSYAVVSSPRLLPVTRTSLTALAAVVALPFLPLVLTILPMAEILKRLWQVVLP